MIKKFQSPAGSIQYQQAHSGAFSVDDPYTAGYDKGSEKRGAIRRQLYNVTHSTPYQLTTAGLYMAAPYTFGATAIPAGVMTTAALAGDVSDLSQNGLSVSNAVNTGFDIIQALPAGYVLSQLPKFKRGVDVAEGVYQNAFNSWRNAQGVTDIAKQGFKRGLKQTAKAEAKRDALGRVAFQGNPTADVAYKKASQAAGEAVKNANKQMGRVVIEGKPVHSSFVANNGQHQIVKPVYNGRLWGNVLKKKATEQAAHNQLIKSEAKRNMASEAYQNLVDLKPASAGASFLTGIAPTLKRAVFDGKGPFEE